MMPVSRRFVISAGLSSMLVTKDWTKMNSTITPQQFDPLAGSLHYDSTAAITTAIASTPAGGKLTLPGTESGYLVSNGFTITRPINIVGDGDATSFTGSLPVNTDLFHVTLPAGAVMRDFSFTDMKLLVTGARSWFHIDTTAAANTYLPGLRIADILAPVSPLLYGIWADGLANGAGLSQAEFERCQLTVDGHSPNACIMLQNVGDSIRVKGGLMTGTAYGLYLAQVSGAGSFILDGTNITSSGGLVVQNATKPIFRDFEIELSNFDMLKLTTNPGFVSSGAAIYIEAADGATIGPGQIQAIAGSVNFNEAIYLGAVANVSIDDMRFASTVGGIGINRGAGASGTNIGTKNTFNGFIINVT
jgi:hypothetical protein